MIEVRAGHVICTSTEGEISFGRSRACTIKLDASRLDPGLSRFAGRFRREDHRWHLYNESDRLDLTVEIDGGLFAVVKPGAAFLALPPGATGRVTIQTKQLYPIAFTVAVEGRTLAAPALAAAVFTGEPTTEDMATALALTDDELGMLAALCEARLRTPTPGPWFVPSAAAVCDRLRISTKRAEKIVDNLAVKLTPYVDGLTGDNRARATTRRQRIADFALQTKCVTFADLRRLPPVGS